jgi:hypothetical protein
MKQPGHKDSLESPDKVQQRRRAMERAQQQPEKQSGTQAAKLEPQTVKSSFGLPEIGSSKYTPPTHGNVPPDFRASASSPAPFPIPAAGTKKKGNAVFKKTATPGLTTKLSAITTTNLAKQMKGVRLGSKVGNRESPQVHA